MMMSILCPVMEVMVQAGSSVLDETSQFTKFVLQALAEQYSIFEINNVIGLGQEIINEEVGELCKNGFLESVDSSSGVFKLTTNGNNFYNLIKTIENINNNSFKALVELFSGQIISWRPFTSEKDNDDGQIPEIVQRNLLYNRDYNNSREFLFNEFNSALGTLQEMYVKSVYTLLKFDMGQKTSWVELSIDVQDHYALPVRDRSKCFALAEPHWEIKPHIKDMRIEKHRFLFDYLEKLEEADRNLLSEDALRLLVYNRLEKALNKSVLPFSFMNMMDGRLEKSAHKSTSPDADETYVLPPIFTKSSFAKEDVDNVLAVLGKSKAEIMDMDISLFDDNVAVDESQLHIHLETKEVMSYKTIPYTVFFDGNNRIDDLTDEDGSDAE